ARGLLRRHDAPPLRGGSTALLRKAVDGPSLRDGSESLRDSDGRNSLREFLKGTGGRAGPPVSAFSDALSGNSVIHFPGEFQAQFAAKKK
ncbi:hypothetical protein ACIQNU_43640, partial [Streptomyces sp. NPDC091292]|uniref:hypothetical protein n=1 Tax=Streptomyces sp. NPDC091292 TaxID=3365991 RepID=UPI0038172144